MTEPFDFDAYRKAKDAVPELPKLTFEKTNTTMFLYFTESKDLCLDYYGKNGKDDLRYIFNEYCVLKIATFIFETLLGSGRWVTDGGNKECTICAGDGFVKISDTHPVSICPNCKGVPNA